MTGLEQRSDRGEDLAGIESVASFFISRVDTEVDKRLGVIAGAGDEAAKSKAEELTVKPPSATRSSPTRSMRQPKSQIAGARLQRRARPCSVCSGHRRGVKDKAFAPTRYVTELVAPDTVNTMPEATLKAIGNFDQPIANRVSGSFDAARTVMDDLTVIGVDLADVAKTLEREGVAGFVRSWPGPDAENVIDMYLVFRDTDSDDPAWRWPEHVFTRAPRVRIECHHRAVL